MFLEDCKIIENTKISEGYYLMKVESKEIYKNSNPGQFFMFKLKNEIRILRRPISLHFANKETGVLEFYYEVKGGGTEEIKALKSGETINLQGPLGKGFSKDYENKTILVVAGGMGLAPCKYLTEYLQTKNKVILIAGGRDKTALEILSNFTLPKESIHITTDNGTLGRKGNVIELMREILKDTHVDAIMSCGPHRMMEVVAEVAQKEDVYCEISLEERMACGIKACVGCSIKTLDGMKKVCHDGPVFNGKIIVDAAPQENDSCSCN